MTDTHDERRALIPPRLLDVSMRVGFESGPKTVERVLAPGVLFLLDDGGTYCFRGHATIPVVPYADGSLVDGETVERLVEAQQEAERLLSKRWGEIMARTR